MKRGTLWDRVNELVTEVGELPGDDSRDKTRFKRIIDEIERQRKRSWSRRISRIIGGCIRT